MSTSHYVEAQGVFQNICLLKLPQLKQIARSVGLAQSGRKADIQDRVNQFIQIGLNNNDSARVFAIKELVLDLLNNRQLQSYDTLLHKYAPADSKSRQSSQSQPYSQPSSTKKPWLFFRENPFFVLKKLVTPHAGLCPKAPEGRGTGSLTFTLSDNDLHNLKNNRLSKLLLLCGAYDSYKPTTDVNIEFPSPIEIHFNGTHVKDNVKGIKGKPGTTKPANLTPYVRQKNDLNIIYAFSKSDYLVFCYIVEEVPAEKILAKVLANPRTLMQTTLDTFNKNTNDEDADDEIEEMATRLSLKCPVSFTRMKYPVKSIHCNHLTCFDALSFIYLQEQASTWTCPICNNGVRVKDLSLNEYVLDILKRTPEDCDTVEIELDGSWVPLFEDDDGNYHRRDGSGTVKKGEDAGSTPAISGPATPIQVSIESDVSPTPPRAASHRKASPIVISLDSDDEEFDLDLADSPSNKSPGAPNSIALPQSAMNASSEPNSNQTAELNYPAAPSPMAGPQAQPVHAAPEKTSPLVRQQPTPPSSTLHLSSPSETMKRGPPNMHPVAESSLPTGPQPQTTAPATATQPKTLSVSSPAPAPAPPVPTAASSILLQPRAALSGSSQQANTNAGPSHPQQNQTRSQTLATSPGLMNPPSQSFSNGPSPTIQSPSLGANLGSLINSSNASPPGVPQMTQSSLSGRPPLATSQSREETSRASQVSNSAPPTTMSSSPQLAQAPRAQSFSPSTLQSGITTMSTYEQEKSELQALGVKLQMIQKLKQQSASKPSNQPPKPPPHRVTTSAPSSFISPSGTTTTKTTAPVEQPGVAPSTSQVSQNSTQLSPSTGGAAPLTGEQRHLAPVIPMKRHTSNPSVATEAQNALRANLLSYNERNGLTRAKTIGPPVGNSNAMGHIQALNNDIRRSTSQNNTVNTSPPTGQTAEVSPIPTNPTLERAESVDRAPTFSPSRFSSGTTTSNGTGHASSAPPAVPAGKSILGIKTAQPTSRPKPPPNLFIPSRFPPHTSLEKKRAASNGTSQPSKKQAVGSNAQDDDHDDIPLGRR
ncbi:E3 SUMO-protein ligase SIZ1 [Cyberlindnera fabianii]|uniref:E3 SUMO-protein ligase SIZ1 n=1 Tax=Cyberlindnera fabianii TaxID=36022 RepID=A0A1V2L0H8_CYBFA|nr:E3 SUMO-protein ligase SIZ1 [Cyberlindnera fabianii]